MGYGKKKLLFIALFLISVNFYSQVGIGTTTPNSDALLDIDATVSVGGLLLPRVALTNTTSPAPLTSDVAGMTVYNTATVGDVTPGMYYNNGMDWIRLGATAKTGWDILGNAGTAANTNFVGTTYANALSFRTNNIERFRVANSNQVYAMARGTQAAPFYLWNEDTNTGMWLVQGDELAIGAGNLEFMRLRERGQDEIVFNLPGNNLDFRVESDTNALMFLVDASTNQTLVNSGTGFFADTHFGSFTTNADDGIAVGSTNAGLGIYA